MSPHILLYFIPGNPGYVDYYTDYLHDLKSRAAFAEGHIHVHGRDLAGFRDDSHRPFTRDSPPYDLEVQIETIFRHVASLRRTNTSRDTPGTVGQPYDLVVIAGHSVGAYIALEIFHRHQKDPSAAPHLNLHAGILLFPTVTHIAQSPSGRRLALLASYPAVGGIAHIVAKAILFFWPAWVLQLFVSFILGQSPAATKTTVDFLKSRDGVWQALHMGQDEMRVIAEDKWDDALWDLPAANRSSNPSPRFFFFFGENDHWVSNRFRDHFIASRTKHVDNGWAHVEIDRTGLPHAFCTTQKNSRAVAAKTAGWLREIWDAANNSSKLE
ncbi:hypothetical protein D7B24_006480 [Verticillium nonalfalfae]|uniref:AB hydrolase-1 domain-containing protein n=1 Tax=Verticillium nonalfalfae TaxID=1051616 RepID=A0A3M9YC09_9PEZI|nr:uncharacterized protein D7B24_006480 [Verticillium nonalfalfae]RNJ57088.1 hypothetical protein D7B24_006480 [Verticillium nonalfalfae]